MLRSIKVSEDEEIEKKRLMDELIEFQRQMKLKEEEV
jgi:hypothetical protein